MQYIIRKLMHPEKEGNGQYEHLFHIPAGLDVAEIASYSWDENGYRPRSCAYVGWNGQGLHVYMYSLETKTRAVATKTGDMVCQDSCLEFFLNPDIQRTNEYFNYECSVRPCVYLSIGEQRHGRRAFFTLPEGMQPSAVVVKDVGWCVHYVITNEFLQREFGVRLFSGLQMRGNFYKCGDLTAYPHFGSFSPIDSIAYPKPDFHRPEFFSSIVLE